MEWFKMQKSWAKAVERLSDAEAGRFLKAVCAFAFSNEEYIGNSGREDPTTWQAIDALREDIAAYQKSETDFIARKEAKKEKCRQAAEARWKMQSNANASECMQANADASERIQTHADASQNKNGKEEDVVKENPLKGVKEKHRFSPPTPDEVKAYCVEKHLSVDEQRFVDFYESKGWKVGSSPMRDWKAAVRNWASRDRTPSQPMRQVTAQQYTQRDYTEEELESRTEDLFAEAIAAG